MIGINKNDIRQSAKLHHCEEHLHADQNIVACFLLQFKYSSRRFVRTILVFYLPALANIVKKQSSS